MKLPSTQSWLLSAVGLALLAPSVNAQLFSYSDQNVLLAFRPAAGNSSTDTLLVNLGPVSNFYNAAGTSGFVVGNASAVTSTFSSLANLDPTIGEAARNLGATPLTAFRRVTLPAIRPGLVAATLFGFVTSFGNLEASLFLVAPGRTTLPIAVLQYLAWKIDPTVAAVSLLQILGVGAAMLITNRFVRLSQVV